MIIGAMAFCLLIVIIPIAIIADKRYDQRAPRQRVEEAIRRQERQLLMERNLLEMLRYRRPNRSIKRPINWCREGF
jgi:hypothetical protein